MYNLPQAPSPFFVISIDISSRPCRACLGYSRDSLGYRLYKELIYSLYLAPSPFFIVPIYISS